MKGTCKINLLLLLVCVLMATACSTTKNLAEDEVLYVGVKNMDVVNEDNSDVGYQAMEEVEAALSYPPNGAILYSNSLRWPLPLGLWIYNGMAKYKDTKGLGHWIYKRMAAKPVYLSTVNAETRAKVATNLLHDYGFFGGKVTYSIDTLKNPRKAKVNYRIDMATPYFLDSIAYLNYPARVDSLISASYDDRLLHRGDHFSVLALEEERQRVGSLLRDNGFYYYRPEFITFRADTLQNPGNVSLQIVPVQGVPEDANKQYYIGNTSIYLTGYNKERPTDSIAFPRSGITLHYSGDKPGIRPGVLLKRFFYKKGELYSQSRQTITQDLLTRLGVFKSTDFRYTLRDTIPPDNDTLDIRVNATFDQPYDMGLEFNVTTKSSDQAGPGAIFSLSRKNFLRTAATLSFQLKGSYEWQTNSSGESGSAMNSYEIGASVSLEYPRLVLPWSNMKLKRSRFPQHTTFRVNADLLNRARFFKMLSFGGSVTYDFRRSRLWKHSVTPFSLEFNTLQSTTARFDSITAINRSLALSLGDQFIPSMSYTLTYDNSALKKKNSVWWETTLTSAGNVTSLLFAAFGKGLTDTNKDLLGSPYAQFLKMTSEVRYLIDLGEKKQIATRLMGGIVYSYGNQMVTPYSEQFYIGGANSIRAFTVRSIGPGRYHPDEDDNYGYLDETGDVKIEANVEYRFPIFGDLYGAAFLDAGNVWQLRSQRDSEGNESRPGGKMTLRDLGKSIALGTGLGLRYDLDFLVVRLDLGIGIHAPYDTGKSGYYNIRKFWDGLGLHFAIGYPF